MSRRFWQRIEGKVIVDELEVLDDLTVGGSLVGAGAALSNDPVTGGDITVTTSSDAGTGDIILESERDIFETASRDYNVGGGRNVLIYTPAGDALVAANAGTATLQGKFVYIHAVGTNGGIQLDGGTSGGVDIQTTGSNRVTVTGEISGSKKIIAAQGLGVGNSVAATTPGSVVKKMQVFDQFGASLGFIPIYSTIT